MEHYFILNGRIKFTVLIGVGLGSIEKSDIMKNQQEEVSMSTEIQIEKEIQDNNLNAPRLTPDHIDGLIIGETYTNLPDGRTVICQLTLKNGFTVDGKSACVSKENFNQDIGNKISRQNAREKIWELEGYLLKDKLFNS